MPMTKIATAATPDPSSLTQSEYFRRLVPIAVLSFGRD